MLLNTKNHRPKEREVNDLDRYRRKDVKIAKDVFEENGYLMQKCDQKAQQRRIVCKKKNTTYLTNCPCPQHRLVLSIHPHDTLLCRTVTLHHQTAPGHKEP